MDHLFQSLRGKTGWVATPVFWAAGLSQKLCEDNLTTKTPSWINPQYNPNIPYYTIIAVSILFSIIPVQPQYSSFKKAQSTIPARSNLVTHSTKHPYLAYDGVSHSGSRAKICFFLQVLWSLRLGIGNPPPKQLHDLLNMTTRRRFEAAR